ncbi:hypothetical protein A7U60_g7623 [Sanghuangporus baumii]|uniref:Uncharacterized protein n=1 Tax=Sanghuangporus baumii TaxID=108892 RepID=A0A9Q5HSR9_SANBA|nr:hypothetical protein A7U60_g7623 [Sanghuangporus baumii]
MLGMLNLRRPTPEMIRQASSTIEQLKQDVSKERTFRPEHVRHLSDAEKGVFPGQFEFLCNVIRDISRFYQFYLAATSDLPLIRGIINMLDMCDKQRQLVQSANPVYVLDIGTLQRLTKTALEVKSKIFAAVQQLRAMEQNQARAALPQQGEGGLAHPPPIQQSQSPANIAPSPAPIPPRPPTVQPQPPHLPQQNLRPPPARTPQMAPARPSSVVHSRTKAPTGTSPNAQDTVPSPSASTPLPNGATPSHVQTSPQTPKSPKGKGQAKSRQKARRQSKVVQPNANAGPATSAPPSTAPSATVAPTSTPAAEPAPSPAQVAPSPAESSLKRLREDEPTDQAGSALPSRAAADETPSKRIKTDWENVPDAEPSKRQAEAESIKTPGQAAQFYNDMTQILELSNDTALPPELHDTLAQLVKTVGHGLEVPDATGSSSVGLPSGGTSSPKVADGDDSFFSFLDFTAFQQDDEKADTPELVPTSSTNPSPESGTGSETEHPPAPATSGSVGDRTKIVDSSESEPKTDLFDMGSDSLRLGIWGEIDGGESGYFNSSDMWKWDSIPPSSGDNSWAIST